MKTNFKRSFKLSFLIGLILSFISLFLDWFHFQIYSNNTLVASWNYNILTEWTTRFSQSSVLNMEVKPNELGAPFIINFIYIGVILIAVYGILFKDPENEKALTKLYPFSYVQLFLIILNCYYLIVFPIIYLIPNELYFPFLLIENASDGLHYYYAIGFGYCLQIFTFILIFPYAIFYYRIIVKFELRENSPKKVIDRYIRGQITHLDFDKLIAEENLKQKFEDLEDNYLFNQESEILDKERIRV